MKIESVKLVLPSIVSIVSPNAESQAIIEPCKENQYHLSTECNLLEQILVIQDLKSELGVESLAASDLESWFASSRIEKANWMGRAPHNPDDLSTLEQRLKKELNPDVMVAITNAMINIIQGVDSESIPNMWYRVKPYENC